MSILFLLKSFEIGGLEVVTSVLANKFVAEGHDVTLWAFYKGKTSLEERLDKRVNLVYGHGFHSGKANVASLRNIIIEKNIQIAINQWGLPYIPAKTLKRAFRGLDVKTIAVYHNDPSTNGRLKEVEIAIEHCDNPIKLSLLKFKLWTYRKITSASMRYIYRNSDRFMVLSQSFISHFEDFTGISNAQKLIAQTNPVTIKQPSETLDLNDKKKEVIYVGRLDYNQKRTYRIIETWALLEDIIPDWRLTIVGDGPERENLERFARDLNLQHVRFEGFQRPEPYYKRASILILTSEYEGFPLVLAECMSFGVVPVVYGSYSAVYDIIKDGENGLIVKPQNGEFKAEAMAKALEQAMTDEDKRHDMAEKSIATSQNYSLDVIYKQWEGLFNDLK